MWYHTSQTTVVSQELLSLPTVVWSSVDWIHSSDIYSLFMLQLGMGMGHQHSVSYSVYTVEMDEYS